MEWGMTSASEIGDAIRLNEADFILLAAALFAELETKSSEARTERGEGEAKVAPANAMHA